MTADQQARRRAVAESEEAVKPSEYYEGLARKCELEATEAANNPFLKATLLTLANMHRSRAKKAAIFEDDEFEIDDEAAKP